MKNKKMIFLVGGGTGGHFVPLYALFNEIKKQNPSQKVLIIGGGGPLEEKYFKGTKEYRILTTGKIHRSFTFRNLWQLILLVWGIFSALFLILREKPRIIFSKGGFVSWPIILWARILKIPYFIHESDVAMGLANRFSFNGAKKVFVGFPLENYPEDDRKKLIFSGQISDKEKSENHTKYDFGFTENKPIILVTGGSQGAKKINRIIYDSLPLLLNKYNIIHQVGSLDYPSAIDIRSKVPEDKKNSYFISDFLGKSGDVNLMERAISVADLIISRASATTIAEIASFAKPMILIPYKYAALNHQEKNAEILKKADAAVVMTEDQCDERNLFGQIEQLFTNPKAMRELGRNAKQYFPENGAKTIANQIMKEVL